MTINKKNIKLFVFWDDMGIERQNHKNLKSGRDFGQI